MQTLTREQWLIERRSGIGGSESPALFGEHPFLSAYALWTAKRFPEAVPPDDGAESDPLWWGRALEPVIRARYEYEENVTVSHPDADAPWLARSEQEPFILASVDGLRDTAPGCVDAVWEAKSALYAGHRWQDETPPLYTQVQVQQYLFVTGMESAVIGVVLGFGRCRFFTLDRHEPFQERLRNVVGEWWHRHVIKGHEPLVDGSQATRRALAGRFPRPEPGKVIQLTGEMADRARDLAALKAERKAIESMIANHENKLRAAMGDANEARLPDGTGYRAIHIPEATIPATTRRAYTKIQKVK